ncbi:hypothetical protein [Nonomuraea sp. NPDC050202]|uniref:hypothetical protein n=1 Tax=Nonomuraea sp. NPDC050202 TaxID=3155035 RepID=UPI0034108EEC
MALARVRGRVRRLTSLQAWQEQAFRREQEQAAENDRLRAELAAQQHLIQAYQCALGLDPAQAPPPQLVLAWHTASDDYISVAVEADGVQWLLVVDGQPRVPNPVKEFEDWQRIKRAYTRADRRVDELKEQMEGE